LPAKTGSGGPNSTVNTRTADVSMIPLIGKIAAGEPLPVPWDIGHHINEDQMIEVPPFMLGNVDPNEVFALQVQGDSMIDSMIQDGDIVLFRRIYAIPNNGDMVAVWIEKRGETTLKHFYHEGHRIRLQPSHPTMAPIYVEPADCQVHGKVIAVMRRM
jgi:repressor LexA